MTGIRVTKKTEVTFTGKINLGDLRAFLDACGELVDETPVTVKHHDARDQRDDTYTTITVGGAV